MELLETLLKLIGLVFFYTFFFLFGVTMLCFMMVVSVAFWISALVGVIQNSKVDRLDYESEEGPDVYACDTLVLYKKEEYPATIMYQVKGSEFDILSITNAQEDFTEILPDAEMARLRVELEYSHVN